MNKANPEAGSAFSRSHTSFEEFEATSKIKPIPLNSNSDACVIAVLLGYMQTSIYYLFKSFCAFKDEYAQEFFKQFLEVVNNG